MRHRWNLLWFALSGGTACITLWVIYAYGSTIPLGDQWWTPAVFVQELHEGTFNLNRLFSQHNESRKAVTRLLWGYPIYWWGWNTRLELTLTWLSVVSISGVLWQLLRKTQDLPASWRGPVFFTMNVLVFGLASWEYWIWSLSVEAYIPTLALVISIWLAKTRASHWVFWCVSSICTVIAIFSYANGLFLIPIVLYVGFLRYVCGDVHKGAPLRNGIWAVVSVVVFATCVFFYFRDYYTPGNLPGVREGLTAPLQTIPFFARWLSGPFSVALGDLVANLTGAVVLVVYLAITAILGFKIFRPSALADSLVIWTPLLFFSMVSGAVTSLSRGMMAENLYMWRSSRYVCFSVFAVIAALPIGLALFHAWSQRLPKRKKEWTVGVALFLIVVFSGVNSLFCYRVVKRQKIQYDHGEQLLSLRKAGFISNIRMPKSQKGAPLAHQLKTADWMMEHGYLKVPDIHVPVSPGDAPYLEGGHIGTFTLKPNGALLIGGWAVPYEEHYVVLLGKGKQGKWRPVFSFPHIEKARPQISERLQLDGFEHSGFHWEIPSKFLPADIETWVVLLWDSERNQLFQFPDTQIQKIDRSSDQIR